MTARGVLQESQGSLRDLGGDKALLRALEAGLDEALEALAAARLEEGASLCAVLTGAVEQMESAIAEAETHAGEQPAALRARLVRQLADIGADQAVDADRLAAEVALSAAKADVREELDRLKAHFETARGHLTGGSPAGRKLDFLAQELNREANTLCSKSTSLGLTNTGLSLKALVDQFKEQAANVE